MLRVCCVAAQLSSAEYQQSVSAVLIGVPRICLTGFSCNIRLPQSIALQPHTCYCRDAYHFDELVPGTYLLDECRWIRETTHLCSVLINKIQAAMHAHTVGHIKISIALE